MDDSTGERRRSQRDREYTPHEHEELRALAKKSRERSHLISVADRANGDGTTELAEVRPT